MISRSHKCIFVHIPRCAGTSVERVIWPRQRCPEDLWMGFIDDYRNKYQTGGLQHLLARQIRQEVGAMSFRSFFKFTVVRNPFDRAVSQFFYMQRRPDLRAFIGMDGDASFSEYLTLIRSRRHVQWEPQCSFIYDDDGALLLDFVGRFETLEADLGRVFDRLGIAPSGLPHANATDRVPYREYHTPDSRTQVEEFYDDDLRRLGYVF
ncbi:MAG TPA: sulfotransferase family 2 domain-containing protein [Solirubrobacterales bacterium]|nr:sulfotransferase family 2 domain-containing protein [Solirubrobacterales bacterium]